MASAEQSSNVSALLLHACEVLGLALTPEILLILLSGCPQSLQKMARLHLNSLPYQWTEPTTPDIIWSAMVVQQVIHMFIERYEKCLFQHFLFHILGIEVCLISFNFHETARKFLHSLQEIKIGHNLLPPHLYKFIIIILPFLMTIKPIDLTDCHWMS
jgi:hypothetical protein